MPSAPATERFSVAPLRTLTVPGPVPVQAEALSCSRPEDTSIGPVNVFAPLRSTKPVPNFVKPTVPATAEAMMMFPAPSNTGVPTKVSVLPVIVVLPSVVMSPAVIALPSVTV